MKDINILFITDIHIGNLKVPGHKIYQNLTKYVYPYINDDLDMLIIGGDYFDALIDFDGSSGVYAAIIIDELIQMAHKHNFLIRVIRGTFSHDRNQNQMFTKHEKMHTMKTGDTHTVKVFDSMGFEYITKLGISFLYIPDDLPYNDAFERAKDLLKKHQIDKVDFVVHHGYCTHMLPEGIKKYSNVYSADQYRELATAYVLNGHVHDSYIHDNFIISGGSFERFVHNEEEEKGCYLIKYNPETGKKIPKFIKNEGSTIFFTLDLTAYDNDIEGARLCYKNNVANILKKLEPDDFAYIRIVSDNPVLRQTLSAFSKAEYKNIHLTTERRKEKKQITEELTTSSFDVPPVTPDSLPRILFDKLGGKLTLCEVDAVLKKEI